MTEHFAQRPEWTCRVDGMDWPCEQAKADLTCEYDGDPLALAIYVLDCLVDASETLPAKELYERFLRWLPRQKARPLFELFRLNGHNSGS